jgi:phage terminase small subunit
LRGGHNRKPTALKVLEGTARPDRMNPREPAAASAPMPAPPAELDADERAVWERLAPVVDALKVATAADVEAFHLAILAVARFHRVARNSDATTNQFAKAHAVAMNSLAQFGLTPAQRAKVSTLPDAAAPNPLRKFGLGSRAG